MKLLLLQGNSTIFWYFWSLKETGFLKDSQIILGIDPGTLVMGYGLISVNKSKVSLIEMGVLQLSKHKDHADRLHLIFKKMESLIKIHQPSAVAIEAPFFGKNVQSMLKLGRAQGVAIAAAMMTGLHAEEYSPRKVKQSITGRGNATKEQVLQMLVHILNIVEDIRFMDATDAVAVALCHHYQQKTIEIKMDNKPAIKAKKKTNDWASFIAANPGRIK
jgi:crossover junction endodeoxyribonuclease RuvC